MSTRNEIASPAIRQRALIVLGAPRSGTTLAATALGAHPRIALLSEDMHGGLFRIVGGKLPALKLCVPNQIDLDRRWRPAYALVDRNGWLRKNLGYHLPHSRLSLRDMAEKAELKVLCLLRDPGRNIDALKRRENKNDRVCRDIVQRTYALFRRLGDEPAIDARIVSFDRFVQNPEPQLRAICDWLGLGFDPLMLEAPKLNPFYPESGFLPEKAASAEASSREPALDSEYRALLARAL